MLEGIKLENSFILFITIALLLGLTFLIGVVFIIKKVINILNISGLIKPKIVKHFPNDCEKMSEFKEKFKNCQPATITMAISKMLIYHYEILGKEGNKCKVKSFFVKNIDPNLVNKEMYSLLDPKLDFEKAVKKDLKTKSRGPLHDIMTGKKKPYEM